MHVQTVEGNEREELQDLQDRLNSKIRVRLICSKYINLIWPRFTERNFSYIG